MDVLCLELCTINFYISSNILKGLKLNVVLKANYVVISKQPLQV